jgi:hypothetical protein
LLFQSNSSSFSDTSLAFVKSAIAYQERNPLAHYWLAEMLARRGSQDAKNEYAKFLKLWAHADSTLTEVKRATDYMRIH